MVAKRTRCRRLAGSHRRSGTLDTCFAAIANICGKYCRMACINREKGGKPKDSPPPMGKCNPCSYLLQMWKAMMKLHFLIGQMQVCITRAGSALDTCEVS